MRIRTAAALALVLGLAGVVDAAAAPGRPPAAAPATAATDIGVTCQFLEFQGCVLLDGITTSMATPLLRSAVRGNDGGWTQPTSGFVMYNYPANAQTASGIVNGRPVGVVPSGGGSLTDNTFRARGTVVYAVAGRSYRYLVHTASITLGLGEDRPSITVRSGTMGYPSCYQRGAGRNPVADCGTGTEAVTGGTVVLPGDIPAAGTIFTFQLPLNYIERPVNSRGGPLSQPTRSSRGHWKVTSALDPHGLSSLWSTEWSIGGVAAGRQSGASYVLPTANHPVASHSNGYTV